MLVFKRLFLFLYLLYLLGADAFSQQATQVIRGRVLDKESQMSLPGANVILATDTSKLKGVTSDLDGYFRLENVPLGRQTIQITFIGYNSITLPDITVSSGKEVVLNIELEESIHSMDEVVIEASQKDQTVNEMAIISARTFSVEEADRYAGSRGDPARMASNFAGVQGADDSRNDIVIRGNSPMSVLWRLEGVDIPNPNHFAIAGTGGGPVSMINNMYLANSDFFTSAFPAEYGNTVSGVFDLKMRNGNNEKHERIGQFGFLGTEMTVEGPVSREKRSSYLAGYRYSTLSIFHALGIDIGTSAVPQYQDLFVKLNLPQKNGGNISVFGVGGMSTVDIISSKETVPTREIYGIRNRDQYFGSGMGVAGVTYTKSFNSNTYGKFTLAHSRQSIHSDHDQVYRHIENEVYVVDSIRPKLHYSFMEDRSSANWFINKKIGSRNVVKLGVQTVLLNFNYTDSVFHDNEASWQNRMETSDHAFLIQPFIQWKHRFSEKLTFNTGLHSQMFTLNNSISAIEPRVGLKWALKPKHLLSAGAGMHSQMQPAYVYFQHQQAENGTYVQHNRNMGFTRSVHYVLGYDFRISSDMRIKAETYYQQLYNIPVEATPSSFSLVNQGTGFERFFPDKLVNKGTGENYGVELTVEKFFSKKYFLLSTISLFESKYTGSDGVKRNTDFNGNYIFNLLATREFKIRNKSNLSIGTNLTAAGGKRYAPADVAASERAQELVVVDSLRNSLQLRDYFRTDIRITYHINAKKISHEIALDLINIFDVRNVLTLTYAPNDLDPTEDPIREEYQLGRLPIFYYRIYF